MESAKLSNEPPKWFTVTAIVLCIWNLLGVMAFIMGPTLNDSALAALPEVQQQMYLDTPLWAVIAFAIAVFAGTLGCVFLALKKCIAKPLLIASLVSVLVQMFHAYFISNSWQVFGPGGAIMPAMVIAIAIYLVILTNKAQRSGWIS